MSACADDPFDDKAATVEGIYLVDSHTRNEAACSPGGEAVEDTEGYAFAKRHDLLGLELLDVTSCSSVLDCQAKEGLESFGPVSFGFALTDLDGDALTAVEVGPGFPIDGTTCEMPELATLKLVMDGETLRLERRIQIGADYTPANGTCTTDQGRASAEAAPCSQLETLTAFRIEDL
jgi:hypothetical protein